MTVHRFFVAAHEMAGERFPLPPSIERQVRTVLRLGDGERIALLPGDGTEALCRLERGSCVVEERRRAPGEPVHRLTVVQSLLKGDGLETVVRHGTEIGVARFVLVVAERSIVRDLPPRRLDRLRAIAREAAEQSERGVVPDVVEPRPFAEAVADLPPAAVLLYERHEGDRLVDLPPPPAVVIGPEGGLAPSEVEAALASGLRPATLGPRILRAQTVATAVAAVVLSRTADFA